MTVVLLALVSFGVFALLYVAPGSVEQILIGTNDSTPAMRAAIRAKYNLDDPFLAQYLNWLGGAVQLDFGESVRTSSPVIDSIGSRLNITLLLGSMAFFLTLLVGIPLGIVAALRQRSTLDRGIVGIAVFGVSAPAFATGIFLIYVFAVLFEWFPPFGAGEGVLDRVWHLILPALALALSACALVVKLTRTAMINSLEKDYITFARARGLSRARVLWAYAFRNALIPVVTAVGLLLGYTLTGAILVEVTFAVPGMGSLLVESVTAKDFPMVQGVVLITATVIILANVLADLAYALIDPRIRLGR